MDVIRRIEERDFQGVASLFTGDDYKSIEELKWVLRDPENSSKFNAFVALKNSGKIVGVIGYSNCLYVKNNIELNGVIFMSWMLSSNYKGFAGISLLKKVSNLGNFAFAIAGSRIGKSFYPLLKYDYKSEIKSYYKVLSFFDLLFSLKRTTIVKKLAMFSYIAPSYFQKKWNQKLRDDIEFISYNGINFVEEIESDNVFKKKISKNYIDWLLDCPLLNTYAFVIKKREEYLGICVLYIEDVNTSKRGRIVHMPFFGYNMNTWNSVIYKCIDFFKNEGCCLVTAWSHHYMNNSAFIASGFISVKRHKSPLFVKGNLLDKNSIDIKDWFLQYSEGDKGYRDL